MSDPSSPLFLRAVNGEDTATAPVWIMRQAGRYLPEYRALKEKHTFWQMVRTPELAAEVSLQPLRRFDLDAVILFSDIMTPLSALGVELDFDPGPVIRRPIRSLADVRSLRMPAPDEIAPFVARTLSHLKGATKAPVIGFAGAPLTLAAYLVEGRGSKDFAVFRGFLQARPDVAHALLSVLADLTVSYLQMQVAAGADVVQLFDSWAGLLDERAYRTYGLPYAQRVLRGLRGAGGVTGVGGAAAVGAVSGAGGRAAVSGAGRGGAGGRGAVSGAGGRATPRIYLAVGASHLYGAIAELDVEAVSVDWRTPLSRVRSAMAGKALQGNLDPAALLAPRSALGEAIDDTLTEGLHGPHVFNLGHGILQQTDPDQLAFLVDRVHAFDRRPSPIERSARAVGAVEAS